MQWLILTSHSSTVTCASWLRWDCEAWRDPSRDDSSSFPSTDSHLRCTPTVPCEMASQTGQIGLHRHGMMVIPRRRVGLRVLEGLDVWRCTAALPAASSAVSHSYSPVPDGLTGTATLEVPVGAM